MIKPIGWDCATEVRLSVGRTHRIICEAKLEMNKKKPWSGSGETEAWLRIRDLRQATVYWALRRCENE